MNYIGNNIGNFSSDTLLEEGIILLGGVIDGAVAQRAVCQLLYLDMNYVSVDVQTVGIGCAASMAAFLLSSGSRGKRCALPNTEVMIHQPLGGAQGQAEDIIIAAKHIERTRDRLNAILAENTGKSIERIAEDTDRDYVMYADEAREYGIIDQVIDTVPKAWR